MNFDFEEKVTPNGAKRIHVNIWDFGPQKLHKTRRYKTKNEMLREIEALRKEEQELFNPPAMVKAVKTFGELLEDHKNRKQNTFSAGWLKNFPGYWREFEKDLGNLPYTQVTPSFLTTLQKALLAKGNSQKTVNNKLGWIRSVIRFAWKMEEIPDNPAAKYEMTKAPEAPIQFWVREDAEDFLKYASAKYPKGTPDRWKYVVYFLAINAGLRAGEIWALKPRCLKRSMGLMYIEEQWDTSKQEFKPPKGKGPRNVPLNSALADELEALIEANGTTRNALIFSNAEGNPICHDNFVNRTFDVEFKSNIPMNVTPKPTTGKRKRKLNPKTETPKWDGPQIKFHGLRHTFGTLAISDGVDVKTVQSIMGHKDLITTMNYVHSVSENIRKAGEIFSVKPAPTKLKAVR